MMNLERLPQDLILAISTYLNETEKIWFGSCSRTFYNDLLIHHLRFFRIRKNHFFHDYESNQEMRERFAKCVRLPESQLKVSLSKSFSAQSIPFPRIYHLNVYFDVLQHLLPQIEKIHSLDLHIPPSSTTTSSVLHLTENYGIKNLKIFTNDDRRLDSLPVIPPHSLETLSLSGRCLALPPGFIDIFSHLYELTLINVEAITDLRLFVSIEKIGLHGCNNIIDLTPLQTTRDITIVHCERILDYRNALTYSSRIEISSPHPEAIIDIACFKAVQSLELELSERHSLIHSLPTALSLSFKRFKIVGNIPPPITHFDHLQEVTIASSKVVTKVDAFGSIPIVRLINLPNVESLHGLGYDEDHQVRKLRNKFVSIFVLEKVKDFTPLNTIAVVEIWRCDGFYDPAQVKDVKTLSIQQCYNILLPSVPMKCEEFTFGGKIPDNLFFHPLPNVKILDLTNVTGLKGRDLNGLERLTNLQRVVLWNGWKEKESEGWALLERDYFKVVSSRSTITYVKKAIV